MNIKTLVSAAALTLFAAGAFAQAASTPKVDKRQDRQEARIQQGAASGSLTPREQRRLMPGQPQLDRQLDRQRLTPEHLLEQHTPGIFEHERERGPVTLETERARGPP